MSKLSEAVERDLNANMKIPDGKIKPTVAMDPGYADALEQHKKRLARIKEMMKKAKKEDELKKPFLGTDNKKDLPKEPVEPKLTLDESLFKEAEEKKGGKGKRSTKTLSDLLYDELCSDVKGIEAKGRRLKGNRYPYEQIRFPREAENYGDIISVMANTKDELDFAKKVAKEYNVNAEEKHNENKNRNASGFEWELWIDTTKSMDEDLKVYQETDLTDFEFWSGAKDTVKYLTADELRQIASILEDSYPDGMTDTEVNDFFWFEDDTIAEWLGYSDFDELMEDREDKE